MKCDTCMREVTPDCDWQQGRCPYRKPMIEIQPKDTSKGHFYVSIVKSGIRMGAGIALIRGELITAGALLIIAECLGILEEVV